MDTEKRPTAPPYSQGTGTAAADSVIVFQLPEEDESHNVAEKRAASPPPTSTGHEKSADHHPVLEVPTIKSGEPPKSLSAIAPARTRIYGRYEVDAEVRSSSPPPSSLKIARPDPHPRNSPPPSGPSRARPPPSTSHAPSEATRASRSTSTRRKPCK